MGDAEALQKDNKKSSAEVIADKALSSGANLIKLLPTTTVLAFQLLSPSFTNGDHCYTANRYLTSFLLGLCGISCFVASFTDSYLSADGTLYYGFATTTGLWILNGRIDKTTLDLSSYKLRFIDFVHASLSMAVFGCLSLMDKNVVNCYYENAQDNAEQLLKNVPLGMGFACSLFFVIFPTVRHGIGYPAGG
ncbi:hypothetical protein SUGI_0887200 [Cryptomeria japonica]|uniref:protein DMP6-like n=1 Tax=Cryptomeria japonica TaxID=3369 RepID=UPI00241479FA|nr:protein DMP6-like [Cryptomeria japonica]GLJ42786.1 hypothetical protein SUGI_0887200 [Cryptomeria japonica]